MRVLFNCSVNVVGGAVQNAYNFIINALGDDAHEFLFVVSKEVADILHGAGYSDESVMVVDSPARSVVARKMILDIERAFNPDVVYTMAGPTYVKFQGLHVMGVSDPYITHSDVTTFFVNRPIWKAGVFYFKEKAKGWYARLSANYFVFQTETSQSGFCNKFFLNKDKTSILPNAIGLDLPEKAGFVNKSLGEKCRVFVPSAYYPHKNIEIIIEIAALLKSRGDKRFFFILTVPFDSMVSRKINEMSLQGYISNIGPYSYREAANLYSSSDLVLVPSVLETFSTSYLEAIAFEKPLLVADKPFAREVCGEYAFYYSPRSAEDALSVLADMVGKKIDVIAGKRIISFYGDQAQRYRNAISILEERVNRTAWDE